MATRTCSAPIVNNVPLIGRAGEWSPKEGGESIPTFGVYKEGNEKFALLSHTLPKWSNLFRLDADGDSMLMNLFQEVHNNAATHEEAEEVMASMEAAVKAYQQWKRERFDIEPEPEVAECDPEPEVEPEPEVAVRPMPSPEESSRLRSLLMNQTKVWRTASPEEQTELIQLAFEAGASTSVKLWEEFRKALTAFSTAKAVLTA
jgi:hypothetical protein